jgi:type IV secretion system protein VirB10
VFIAAVGVLIATIALQARFGGGDNASREREKNYRAPQPSGFSELAAGMRRDRKPVEVIRQEEPKREPEPVPSPVQKIVIEAPKNERRVYAPPLPRYYSDRNDAQATNTLRTMKLQALTAKPVVENFELRRNDGNNAEKKDAVPSQGTASGNAPAIMDSSAMAALMQQGQQPDPNGQAGKIDFLRSGGGSLTPQGYSANLPVPQQFPYELKAGTIIPGIMLTGINSDLPGSVIAQVSENVWDTATGRDVLIPKGTRILGVYDSQVTFGQRRVLMVWNRLIFPNGTTLDIAGSPGVDMAGYSGLSGKVNEHWGTMIQAALLASVFVAGAEIVYDSDSQGMGNENKSPRDVAAESAAGAILDLGTKIVNRASDIQPTITIRPGKRMGIFVQKDIVFPFPYF